MTIGRFLFIGLFLSFLVAFLALSLTFFNFHTLFALFALLSFTLFFFFDHLFPFVIVISSFLIIDEKCWVYIEQLLARP